MDRTAFPFGILEADVPILLSMSDAELGHNCRLNSYVNRLCHDDYFWQLRLEKYYPEYLGVQMPRLSYRDLYHQIATTAAYVLVVSSPNNEITVFNDIRAAYEAYRNGIRLELPPIENASEIPATTSIPSPYSFSIYRVNLNRPVQLGSQDNLLLRLGPTGYQVVPSLDRFKVLTPGLFLIYETGRVEYDEEDYDEELGEWIPDSFVIGSLDDSGIQQMFNLAQDTEVDNIQLMSSSTQQKVSVHMYNDYLVTWELPFLIAPINGRYMIAEIPHGVPAAIRINKVHGFTLNIHEPNRMVGWDPTLLNWQPLSNIVNYLA